MELISRAHQFKGGVGSPSDITWEHILEFNKRCEGHSWFETHLPHAISTSYLKEVVICQDDFEELEGLGWTKKKMQASLGSRVQITIRQRLDDVKKSAEVSCSRKQLWNHSGMAFTVEEEPRDTVHSPTGLQLAVGTPQWLRFKASTGAPFILVITEDRTKLACRDDGTDPLPAAPQTVSLAFMTDGSVKVVVSGGQSVTHNLFNNFGRLGQLMGTLAFDVKHPEGMDLALAVANPEARACFEFLEYTLAVTSREITLQHSGGCEAVMPSEGPINIPLLRQFCGIVYVAVSAIDKVRPVTIVDMEVLDASPPSSQEKFKTILRDPASQVKGLQPDPQGVGDLRPFCTEAAKFNKPLELCPMLKEEAHAACFRHVCDFGQDCRYLQKDQETHPRWAEHHRVWCHKSLPPCQWGATCRKTSDPKHRAQFHHAGLKQWMRACFNQACTETGDQHRLNFVHLPPERIERAKVLKSLDTALQ